MKTIMKKSAVVLLALMLILGMAACGGGGASGAENSFVGDWKMVSMEAEGMVMDEAQLAEYNFAASIKISADKKAEWDMGGLKASGTWALKNDTTITLALTADGLEEEETIEMVLDGDSLISTEDDGGKMIYKKK